MSEVKPIKPSDFVHLHNHTQYSLLDGLTKVNPLMEKVANCGMEAVALTDHGTLSGAIDFYKSAKANKLKPIIGIETYIAARKHTDKDPAQDKPNFHLILLAMNNTGYQNIMRLSTIANLEGFYYKPRIDHDLLKKYSEGVIVLSGCIGGEVSDALRQGQPQKAKQLAKWYKSIFKDRYYFEVQDHGHKDHPSAWDEQVAVTDSLLKLGEELDIPCVLTSDAHYLNKEDQEAHEILLCIQTGSFLTDENRMSLKDFELHVSDPKDIIKRWGKENPEVIYNTKKIADRCDVTIDLGKILIPKFDVPKNETEASYLKKLVYRGLAWRYGGKSEKEVKNISPEQAKKYLFEEVKNRAQFELDTIKKMGFNGYFLIIADFMNWGKAQGIVFGPGRGSAAGSIIAYALKITELDPLKYDLLFERFLNPDRISMPDIDLDIQDTRRDEVIQYCVDKYGSDRVANIVTFGTMAARNAVRDVARVLQVPYAEADRLAKMIPPPVQGRHIPLEVSIREDKDLKQEYKSNQEAKRVFDLAIRLEGTIRSHGVHAAGVVIAPDDIVTFVPLEKAQKGVISTQYSMNPVEDLGLLKMDFLGLSNLTIIKNSLRIIKKVYKKDIDINNIPLDDKKTFELFQRGDTTGVFQLESSGMKRYLRELKPTVFEDIVAMGALYRPGPLTAGLTDKFIARKNGREAVTYDHELMKPALKDTYGVMVYQEQFMQIVRDMCGFTGGESDMLRKAVGKKKRDMMAKMKNQVINGALKQNVPKNIAEKFWNDLEGFADYAFNKSHAACYAMIAYQTAYLKAHYPAAFMASLMTSDYDDTDRLTIEITECQHMGIDVLPPDINESFLEFAVVGKSKQIRFGLSAIKNVGTGAAEEILRAREIEGSFKSIEDFLSKTSSKVVNRKTIESLIKSGAFDKFNNRSVLLDNIDSLLAYANRVHKESASGQVDFFGNSNDIDNTQPKLQLDESNDKLISKKQQLDWERELLGLYLSGNPLESYKNILSEQTVPIEQLEAGHHNKTTTVGGIIYDHREITTKNGQKMAFVKLGDDKSDIEVVLFPSIYEQTKDIWQVDRVVTVKGKISAANKDGVKTDELKIIGNEAQEITLEQAENYIVTNKKKSPPKVSSNEPLNDNLKPKKILYIRLHDSTDNQTLLDIKNVISKYPGDQEIILVVGDNDSRQAIKLPNKISYDQDSHTLLADIIGDENIKLN